MAMAGTGAAVIAQIHLFEEKVVELKSKSA
jgi:hypothetical protein